MKPSNETRGLDAVATFASARDFLTCKLEHAKVKEPAGGVCLAESVLVKDEEGLILHRKGEELTRWVWVKKVLVLPRPECRRARLVFLAYEYEGNGNPLLVSINGREVKLTPGLLPQGFHLWRTIEVPCAWLKKGSNTILFRTDATAFNAWVLAVENGPGRGRSHKSEDGGKTWSAGRKGYDGSVLGEYVVRLRLWQHPVRGVVTSPPVRAAGEEGIAPACPPDIAFDYECQAPHGTSLRLEVRSGEARLPEEGKWTHWLPLGKSKRLRLKGHFIQWRAHLATRHPLRTPRLLRLSLAAALPRTTPEAPRLLSAKNGELVMPSFDFGYQAFDHEKLRLLRQQERLDDIVAGAASEFEAFVLLRSWVAKQWKWHGGVEYTPWDGLVILDWMRRSRPEAHGGCIHYGVLLTQCLLSLGYQARMFVIAMHPTMHVGGHFVMEVWSNEHGKWVLLDPTIDVHYEHKGVPLSILEMHELWKAGKAEEVTHVAGTSARTTVLGPDWGIKEYRRGGYRFLGLVTRNDFLRSCLPAAVEHGQVTFHEDPFLWWGDEMPESVCWPPCFTTRKADLAWTLNQVRIDLFDSPRAGAADVLLSTIAPDFRRFEVRIGEGAWKVSRGRFRWRLRRGYNLLQARARNAADVAGRISEVVVERP